MFNQFIVFTRKLIANNIEDFYYLTIDPGLSNLGWCITSFKDFRLINFDRLSLVPQVNIYNNDLRIKKIYEYVREIIYINKIDIVCIEKITFSNGRHPFAENSLLKAIGVIYAAILCENNNLFEINNRQAQSLLIGKASKINKQLIFNYVYDILNGKISKSSKKKIFTKSKNDICDAIFLAYAFRHIILKTIS